MVSKGSRSAEQTACATEKSLAEMPLIKPKKVSSRENRMNSMIRRKKLACLGLAASMVLPSTLSKFSQTCADDTAGPAPSAGSQTASNSDLLTKGVEQYNQGDYDAAVSSLQAVDAKTLNSADRQTLTDTLAEAKTASTERRSAKAEFARGEDARKSGQLLEAEGYYNSVLNNPRADEATREKAQQELTAVQTTQKLANSDGKVAYDRGVDEYKRGLWQQARTDFTTAQAAGYTGGFFEASPAQYLEKIDKGEQKYNAEHGNSQNPQANADADQNSDGRIAYEKGRQAYREGDMATARAEFVKARNLNFQPGFLEGLSPAEYVQRIDADAAKPAASASAATASAAQTVALADDASTGTSGSLQQQSAADQLAEQQKSYKAEGLVDAGSKAEAAGNDQAALNDFTQASELDPTNKAAASGRARLLNKMGRGAGTGGVNLNQTQQQIAQESGAITYQFNSAIAAARKDTEAGNFAAAQNDIADAQAARDQDPTIFDAATLGNWDTQLSQARVDLHNASATAQRENQYRTAQQTANAETARLQQVEMRRRATISALIKQSRAQIDQENYEAALGVIDQILSIDPQNDYALGVRQFVQDKAILQEQRKYRAQFDYNFSRTLNQADEDQIPYEDIYRFPENWPDLSELRDNELKNSNTSKEDQIAQAQLDRRLPNVDLDNIPLSDAIEFLRDLTQSNILVDWKALEADGIDKQTPVLAKLHDVRFSKVLDIVLQQAGGGKLAYTIDDGVISISTSDVLNKAVVTRVYDITDLLINPNFDPTINASGGTAQVTSGGGGGGSSSAITSGGTTTNTQDRAQQLADIKKKIENTVEFSSWKDNDPNGYGQIDDFNNNLIITQTSEVHTKIANLLAQLRETQAVQVSVETRFLTVTRDFLNDVGVNLAVTFNATNPGYFSPITLTNGTSGFTQNPSVGINNLGAVATGLGVGQVTPGGLAPITYGLTAGFLDDFQASLVVNAVQASQRLSVVHAPRVTLQNGQGATILQETFNPYVSSLNVSVSSGAAIAAPVISNALDGVILRIERALVTADHKYVTLDLYPELDAFLGFQTFQYQTATTQTTGTGTGSNTVVSAGGFVPPSLQVQLAREQVVQVRTRVTVPDGGTLMLGGVTIAGEINKEAGVPGLSKIPFLKRLTTNTSEANDEEVLLILVKPTIIVNKEIEAKTFPLLSSNTR
jgi:Flp pilus assembly secretin CpaC